MKENQKLYYNLGKRKNSLRCSQHKPWSGKPLELTPHHFWQILFIGSEPTGPAYTQGGRITRECMNLFIQRGGDHGEPLERLLNTG